MTMTRNRLWIAAAAAATFCAGLAVAQDAPTLDRHRAIRPADGGLIDLPLLRDPLLPVPDSIIRFPDRLEELWRAALARPEADLRREAIRAFADARSRGLEGLEDVIPLLATAAIEDASTSVRLEALKALGDFDDPSAAPAVFEAAMSIPGYEAALIADPILARWGHQPAFPVWTERLTDAALLESVRTSAAHALGAAGVAAAQAPLAAVATNPQERDALRIAAAESLGRIGASGLAPTAEPLATGSTVDRLAAAAMLAGQADPAAINLLRQLTGDPSGLVAASAARSLNRTDTAIIAGDAESLLQHADPAVRLAAVEAVAQHPNEQAVGQLVSRLDDAGVVARHAAREALYRFATEHGLDAPVRQAATAALNGPGWRGQEQAALLIGQLDHEPAADALVALFQSERAEVRLAASAAIRQLSVPEVLPAVLARAQAISDAAKAGEMKGMEAENEATQLFMAIADLEYQPADELLRTYIPKNAPYGATARGAAIYALGKLYRGKTDSSLADQLASRLGDINPMMPEAPMVRRFAAVALGVMADPERASILRRFAQFEEMAPEVGVASAWALEQLIGEKVPPKAVGEGFHGGWFLEPIN